MSIYPENTTINDLSLANIVTEKEQLPVFKEYALDYKTGELIKYKNDLKIATGDEALKVWIYKALKVNRYGFAGYSWNYGSEINNLIGQAFSIEYIKSECKRYVKDALLINPYIKEVENFDIEFNGDDLKVSFKVVSVYGEFNQTL